MVAIALLYQAISASSKINHPDFMNVLQTKTFLDLAEMGPLKYDDTDMKLLHVIRHGNKYNYTQEDLKKYLKLEFI